MVKPYFTRKNLIIIALVFFYALMIVFAGVCLDGAHIIIQKKNIIRLFANSLGFESIIAGTAGTVTLFLMAFYLLVFIACFLYERRYAMLNNQKPYSWKMIGVYALTFVVCLLHTRLYSKHMLCNFSLILSTTFLY